VRPAPDDPVLLTAFNQWMRHQRGVCEATITRYRPDICELLTRVGTDPSRVDAGVLRTLFLEQNRISGSAAVQTCAKALRMFVRFRNNSGGLYNWRRSAYRLVNDGTAAKAAANAVR
jgi:hypothetical protein